MQEGGISYRSMRIYIYAHEYICVACRLNNRQPTLSRATPAQTLKRIFLTTSRFLVEFCTVATLVRIFSPGSRTWVSRFSALFNGLYIYLYVCMYMYGFIHLHIYLYSAVYAIYTTRALKIIFAREAPAHCSTNLRSGSRGVDRSRTKNTRTPSFVPLFVIAPVRQIFKIYFTAHQNRQLLPK